ncbi:hypothetical protein BSZ19_26785 [Bradyrhizobium japonicum]|uniref:Uncharacterized protein n=1 Tax=Bradyrhizobium japonicum TaxID=375 RepID=A0A1Y2JJK6_BRAJP|nr:hypothetical protein BSZ19_26785 [Bradyrhizobium japonicum]
MAEWADFAAWCTAAPQEPGAEPVPVARYMVQLAEVYQEGLDGPAMHREDLGAHNTAGPTSSFFRGEDRRAW